METGTLEARLQWYLVRDLGILKSCFQLAISFFEVFKEDVCTNDKVRYKMLFTNWGFTSKTYVES